MQSRVYLSSSFLLTALSNAMSCVVNLRRNGCEISKDPSNDTRKHKVVDLIQHNIMCLNAGYQLAGTH